MTTPPPVGVKEILGIGAGLAIIKRSSTPFTLAKTGGSTKGPAIAAVELKRKPAIIYFLANSDFVGHGFTRIQLMSLLRERPIRG
jgi:hypothetical protein